MASPASCLTRNNSFRPTLERRRLHRRKSKGPGPHWPICSPMKWSQLPVFRPMTCGRSRTAWRHTTMRNASWPTASLRLIAEAHTKLLASGRGRTQCPGEFRRSQNWIGGSRPGNARFVPPPPDEVMTCMGLLEKFLHDDSVRTLPLIKGGGYFSVKMLEKSSAG